MMTKASTFLTADELTAVEKSVVEAEAQTSVEIVPVIATASGRYDRAEDIAGLWLGIVFMAALWYLWPVNPAEPGDWGASLPLNYVAWIVALLAGFIAGAAISARVGWLRRLTTSKKVLTAEVQRRAREVFFDQRIHHTGAATGVLIYVSLFERTVCILADEAVLKVLPDGEIVRLCAVLTGTLARTPADGLAATIRELGEKLAESLPRAEDDRDELANAVILMD